MAILANDSKIDKLIVDGIEIMGGGIDKAKLVESLTLSRLGITIDSSPDEIYSALKATFPEIKILFSNNTPASGYKIHNKTDGENSSSSLLNLTAWDHGGVQGYCSAYLTPGIDLTNYRRLEFDYSATLYYSNRSGNESRMGIATDVMGAPLHYIQILSTSNGTAVLDLSNITGTYYIGAFNWGKSYTVITNISQIRLL